MFSEREAHVDGCLLVSGEMAVHWPGVSAEATDP